MMFSMLYYDQTQEAAAGVTDALVIGPVRITMEQVSC